MNQKILDLKAPVSRYNPSKKVKEFTAKVREEFALGEMIQTKSYPEFNNRSVIEETNKNQKAFNTYIPPRSEDPDESWRAQTVRPIVRNKLISIAAHVTASIIYPGIFAQNKDDEEDRASAEVMRDLVEWVMNNSTYERTFIYAVLQALTDPATIVEVGFAEVMRIVKEKHDNGTISEKEVIDEIMSGFFMNIVPIRELLIANIYENNIQKQRFLIRRKKIDHKDAKAKYKDRKNWKYVVQGVQFLYSDDNGYFYEQVDPDLWGYLDEEVTYMERSGDLKVTFVNGIIMDDPDEPNPRRDKKYPFAKGGYEPLNNGNFFYYKSAANKLGPDADMVNVLYNMILDGTFLSLMPPQALYGNEEVNSSVFVPGSVTSFRADTKLEGIGQKSDLRAGMQSVDMAERSITESSQDSSQAGITTTGPEKTAQEIGTLQQNAQIALGLFGKFVGFLVKDIGDLMVCDILQHMTVADINELESPDQRMSYSKYLLPDQNVDGKKVTKKIVFTDGDPMKENKDEEYQKSKSFELLNKEGGMDSETRIYEVDAEMFRNLKFKISVSPEALAPKNKALEKALNLEAYDRLIQNPNVDQQAVTKDFLVETFKPGESDKYMAKMPAGMPTMPVDQKGVNSNLSQQLTGSNSLKNALIPK